MKNNQNNQNHDEEKSNHPEMNEEHIEVSKDVPNTVEELIDRQDRCRIDFVAVSYTHLTLPTNREV